MSSLRLWDVMQPKIMFLVIHNWYKWLDCNVGNLPRIVCFYIFFTGTRLNNPIPDNIMGLKIKNRNVHVEVVLR